MVALMQVTDCVCCFRPVRLFLCLAVGISAINATQQAASAAVPEKAARLNVVDPKDQSIQELTLDAWPAKREITVDGPLPSFVKVWIAGDPDQTPLDFSFNRNATQITFHLPKQPQELPSAVKLHYLLAEESVAVPSGVVVLSALDAKVIGTKAALETHPGSHRIGYWNRAEDYVVWDTAIPAGTYRAELVYSRAPKSGTKVEISIGETDFPFTLKQTGSWYRYRVDPLGKVTIPEAGGQRTEIRVEEIIHGGVMNLKAIILTPTEKNQTLPVTAVNKVSFNHDIRPLLSDRCFLCHGPDEASRQAELRLDSREAATQWSIVPGDWSSSEVVARITSDDPDVRMPPPESQKQPLNAAEIARVKQWINEGAEYQPHWAFVPPVRPELPDARLAAWRTHPIDRFVLAKLDQQGREPSPKANKRTLLRRAAFDLTGLPPTRDQLARFLKDESPETWSRALDQLLDSDAYGEHQARHWLDVARYADSNGYQYDFQRDQWVWRDWVINAFNTNQPFDEFTIEQLAGDLLPGATPQQKLATGFNRNHPITVEGGIIDEEYRVEYVLDRTTTAATVWLGMTTGCARCHDHKYDPLSQKEFYQLSAFFNQVPERGMKGFDPKVRIPSPFQHDQLKQIDAQLATARREYRQLLNAWGSEFDAIVEDLSGAIGEGWEVIAPELVESQNGAESELLADSSVRFTGSNPDNDVYEVTIPTNGKPIYGIRLTAMPDESTPSGGPGRSSNGNFILSELIVEASSEDKPDKFQPINLTGAQADVSQPGYGIENAIDEKIDSTGWAVYVDEKRLRQPIGAIFVPERAVTVSAGGKIRLRLHFAGSYPHHQIARLQIAVATQGELSAVLPALQALQKAKEKRSETDQLAIEALAISRSGAAELKTALAQFKAAKKTKEETLAAIPQTMVMRDVAKPRGAYVLERGEYDKRGEHVDPNTPAALPAMPEGYPSNRLGFAQWLTMPDHPLTSRVTVNRVWMDLFGIGFVETPEDFGLQSAMPSHPKLLDWLAVGFVESGWDVKQLFKTIMLSQTYQQDSSMTPDTFARDPDNRFLARGPRMRLDAETIRDTALSVSGLLNQQLGGPSVFPYHPKGLWLEVNNRPGFSSTYEQDTGEKLYRRSVYTYWKRTVPPPSMAVFDAPSREYCQVRRSRTNTPLQAFVLMHDPQFVEAARAFAGRILTAGGSKAEDQIRYGFELSMGRQPVSDELELLMETYAERLEVYRQSPSKAEQLLSVGQSPRNRELPMTEHAAMTSVARLLMNLSEFITKG